MGVYVLKRIGSSFLLLFGLLTIIFIIAHTAPGDPVTAVVSPTMPASAAASLRHEFGLDQSLLTQYTDWIRNAVSGNFGISFRHQRPVTEVIGSFFPNTVILGATESSWNWFSESFSVLRLHVTMDHLLIRSLPVSILLSTLFHLFG